jgi:hypothetical protein
MLKSYKKIANKKGSLIKKKVENVWITLILQFSDDRKTEFPCVLNDKIMKIHDYLASHGPIVGEYQLLAGYPP